MSTSIEELPRPETGDQRAIDRLQPDRTALELMPAVRRRLGHVL